MNSETTLLALVDLVSEAAIDPSLWVSMLEKLKATLGIPWCFFYVHDFSEQRVDIRASIGFDPGHMQSYDDYYAARNPILIHGKKQLLPGNVCRSEMLCPSDVFLKSEFHNDWAAPQGIGLGITATVLKTSTQVGLFGMLQELGASPPSDDVVVLLRRLMPHLQRAVRTHTLIVGLQELERAQRSALDHSQQGIILLDRLGRILSMNRAAEAVLRKRDGLSVGRNGLVAARATDNAKLQSLIRQLAKRTPHACGSVSALPIARERSHRPLELSVLPLASSPGVIHDSSAVCMIVISDPDDQEGGDENVLQGLYQLTGTEAKVAVGLAQGKGVAQIADELRQSLNTTRTHLKRVFEKTRTRRQAELVRLILRGPVSRRPKA